MHRLLRGELAPAKVAEHFNAPTERVAIYQQFARNHIRFLLEKNFQVLSSVLSQATWDELFEEYFRDYPSADYELNGNTEAFTSFLEEKLAAGHPELTAFHVELAELEWQEFAAYADRIDMPKPETVTQATLNPTLGILRFKYPVAEFVDAWHEADGDALEPPRLPEPEEEIVFVMRHPQSRLAVFHRASESLLFAFKLAHDELDVDQAAKQAGITPDLVEQILNLAARIGLLILPNHKPRQEAEVFNTSTTYL